MAVVAALAEVVAGVEVTPAASSAASKDTFPGTVLRPTDANSSILIIFKFQRYVFEIYFVSFSKKSLKRSRYYGR